MKKRMIWRFLAVILSGLSVVTTSMPLHAELTELPEETTNIVVSTDSVVSTTADLAIISSVTTTPRSTITRKSTTTTVHFADDYGTSKSTISSVTPKSFSGECANVSIDASEATNTSIEKNTYSTTMVSEYEEEEIVITLSNCYSILLNEIIEDCANSKTTTEAIQTTKESQRTTEKTIQTTKEIVTTTNIVTTTVSQTTTTSVTTETTTVTVQEENAILLPTEDGSIV